MDGTKDSKVFTRRSLLGATLLGTASVAAGGLLAACASAPPPAATPASPVKSAATAAPVVAPTSAASTSAPAATAAPSTEKFTIKVSSANSTTEVFRVGLAKAYTKDHPNITVEFDPLTDVGQQQPVMVAGGTAGDVFQGYSVNQYKMMQLAGVYADHTALIRAHNFDFGGLLKQAQDGITSQGKIWGIPYEDHAGYSSTFINKNLFDKAGIAIPKLDWTSEPHPGLKNWTFDDLQQAAIPLTKRDGGKTLQWGYQLIGAANTWTFFWCAIRSMGNNYLSDDGTKSQVASPEGRAAIKYYVDLHQKYKVAPLSADSPSGGPNLFASGRIGIAVGASFKIIDLKQTVKDFEWMTLPGPRGKGGNDGGFEFNSYHVLASSKHPDDAFEVLTLMSSVDACRKVREMGGNNGSWKALWEDPAIINDPNFSVVAKTVMTTSGLLLPANGRCNELADVAHQLFDPLYSGGRTDVDQAITEMNTKLQAILDKPPVALTAG